MYQHQSTTLKNGLRLVMIPMPQVESTTVMVGVGAGSRHETKRINGLFHFMEHMAFKGTEKRPSSLDIATEVDAVGGQFNAFTDKEITAYYVKLASKHTPLAFDILSDMLTNSLLKPEEIEREKGVIIEEINMYEDTPMIRAMIAFERILYGDNAMGWWTAGTKEAVKGMKREDFLGVIDRLYFPKNMTVIVAGKLNNDKIKRLTEENFLQLRRKGKKETKKIKLSQKKPKTKLVYKKTEQAHFCLGVPGFGYSHPDRFVLGVLATILGGGMSSRLFTQIRERRGLAYYVKCFPDFSTDSGFLVVRAGVRLKKIEEAIKVTLAELRKISEKKVPVKELKKAQESVKGNMVLALEDSQAVAARYAYQTLLEEKLRTPKEAMALIDEVTVADLQRVAKKIFPPQNFNLALIGPYKEASRFKKLLQS